MKTTNASYSSENINDYYDSCKIDYQRIWALERAAAMHYGCWENDVRNLIDALERENRLLGEMAGIKSTDVILDAGCGFGGSSIYLARNFLCHVVGIDINDKHIAAAKNRANKSSIDSKTIFLVMNYEEMNFEDESFDVV